MAEQVLFSGTVGVSYGQVYLAGEEPPGMDESFAGQVNGLCGAAVPGSLFLVTGIKEGSVPMTVELHPSEPPLSDAWEEIVEVSFANPSPRPELQEWGGEGNHPFRLEPGSYRIRYCARMMDEAWDVESNYDDDLIDAYLLQFWPSPAEPDRIIRQTSRCAAYWHQANRQAEPSPEQAATETAQLADAEEEWLLRVFQGRVPNQRLRAVALAGYSHSLNDIDMDLTFALAEADDGVHRAVAAWAALRALEIARLTELPELAPSVAAIRQGGRAVAPFDGTGYWYGALTSPIPETPVPPLSPVPAAHTPDGEVPEDHTQIRETAAIYALLATGEADSLAAALSAATSAAEAFGGDLYLQFLSDLRQAFPEPGSRR
ncbi:hypothetical protein GCM10010112_65230 [Actinoplanes lobatus]|uniref:Uncharacterized protein n=1 Tax=Actinoplanes lobatus TaxID=113568 RepID=A0A7W7HK44_9ACTN|nr:hypothetical protein [Actinoplanes lobatus]MBB4752000.1 hypothetical protein [Actinoplanes lobatus]GGN85138.1 hypothetical protein GCM10010112_65230 [Actinoplanes lobatus]GIE45330.1 hypothetical protein Alo02nite_82280 [Actinoplanes lobatus]